MSEDKNLRDKSTSDISGSLPNDSPLKSVNIFCKSIKNIKFLNKIADSK